MKWITSIWGWFSGSALWTKLIELIVGTLALAGVALKIRLDGEHAQQGKDAQATLKDVQVAQKVQADVAKLPAGKSQQILAQKFNKP